MAAARDETNSSDLHGAPDDRALGELNAKMLIAVHGTGNVVNVSSRGRRVGAAACRSRTQRHRDRPGNAK